MLFPISDLAWASSWKIGLAKGIKTFSSTIAPMVFNATNDISTLYWIDFAVAMVALMCQLALLRLIKDKKSTEKKKKDENPESVLSTIK